MMEDTLRFLVEDSLQQLVAFVCGACSQVGLTRASASMGHMSLCLDPPSISHSRGICCCGWGLYWGLLGARACSGFRVLCLTLITNPNP